MKNIANPYTILPSLAVMISRTAIAGPVQGLAITAPRAPKRNAPSMEPDRRCAPPWRFIIQAGGWSSYTPNMANDNRRKTTTSPHCTTGIANTALMAPPVMAAMTPMVAKVMHSPNT